MNIHLISGIFLLLLLTNAKSAENNKDGENKRANKNGISVNDTAKQMFGDGRQLTHKGGSGQFAEQRQAHAHGLQRSASMPTAADGVQPAVPHKTHQLKTAHIFPKWGLQKRKEKLGKLNLGLKKRWNNVQSVDDQRIAHMEVVDPKTENVSDDSKENHLAKGAKLIQNDATHFATLYHSKFQSTARLADFENIGASKYSLVPEDMGEDNIVVKNNVLKPIYTSDIKLVRRKKDKKVWALKTVDIEHLNPLDQSKGKTNKFENEQRICKALRSCARKSKQIVHIEDLFVEINAVTGKPSKKYIVMEQGYGDLGQLLDFVGGILPEKAVKFYAAQILLGLEYLHSYGVLYMATRDRNMLFDKYGNIKFIDFENSVVKGSPIEHYKTEHQQVDIATSKTEKILSSELWKLGVLIYKLVTGKKFKTNKENGLKEIFDHPTISDGLKDLIRKLMLGNDGKSVTMEELKRHHFFNYTEADWQNISDLKMTPPYSPKLSADNDQHLLLPVKSSEGKPQFVRND